MRGTDIRLIVGMINVCAAAKASTSELLGRAFHTTLMLTGSVEQSEAAVLESISRLDLDKDPSGEMLMQGALKAAIDRQHHMIEPRPAELDYAGSLLPLELRRILRLPAHLRHSFTLRILAGVPRRVCASLLNLEAHQVDDAAARAAEMLADMTEKAASQAAA